MESVAAIPVVPASVFFEPCTLPIVCLFGDHYYVNARLECFQSTDHPAKTITIARFSKNDWKWLHEMAEVTPFQGASEFCEGLVGGVDNQNPDNYK